jgi:hypothetical protein
MKRLITTIAFFIALVVIAMAIYGVWLWVLRPLGLASHLSAREVEVLNRVVFCGYCALFAILCAGNAIVCWIDKKMKAFLMSLLATAGSVVCGVVFFLHAGKLGAGVLAFGIPMLLAIVFYCLRPFKRWV